MIHEAYMPVYIGSRFSLRRTGGSTRGSTKGPRGPKNEIGTILMEWENAESDLQSEKARGFYSARAVRKVSVGK